MKTILGNYVTAKRPETFKFLAANWPLVCEWAGVNVLPLKVLEADDPRRGSLGEARYEFLSTADGTGCVLLNDEAIKVDFYTVQLSPMGNPTAFLWAFLIAVVRSWMAHTGVLFKHDHLGLSHVEYALSRFSESYQRAFREKLLAEAGPNPGDGACAQLLASIEVFWVFPGDPYDGAPLAAIARARATSFDLVLEPSPKIPPLD